MVHFTQKENCWAIKKNVSPKISNLEGVHHSQRNCVVHWLVKEIMLVKKDKSEIEKSTHKIKL